MNTDLKMQAKLIYIEAWKQKRVQIANQYAATLLVNTDAKFPKYKQDGRALVYRFDGSIFDPRNQP